MRELHSLATKFMVIGLQEMHGNDAIALLHNAGILRSHVLISSHPVDRIGIVKGDSGGVGFLIHRGLSVKGDDGSLIPLLSLPPQSLQPYLVVWVPGRAASIRVWDPSGTKSTFVYDVHNYGLSVSDMTRLEVGFKSDIGHVKSDPMHTSLLLMGDFNLQPPDEPKIKVDTPSCTGTFHNSIGPFCGRWNVIFDQCTEIKFPQPNHFCSATNSLNKLTRIFVFVSRSVLPMLAHQAGVVNDPIFYHAKTLSDHAPSF